MKLCRYRHLPSTVLRLAALLLLLALGSSLMKSSRMVIKQSAARRQVKVILVTYMRSGSSLTGSILSAHPEVFYLFEPLRLITRKKWLTHKFLNKNQTYLKERHERDLKLSTIGAMLNCTFEDVNVYSLMDIFMVNHSRNTLNYSLCLKKHRGEDGLRYCLPLLYRACENATVTLAKTIRLSMTEAEVIMGNDPDVKLMYLTRDPRATIISQSHIRIRKYDNFTDHVTSVCSRMTSDIPIFKTLQKLFPNRVLHIQYERLISEISLVVQQLYQFIGVPSYSQYEGDVAYCSTCKGTAVNKSLINAWRKDNAYKNAQFIQKMCSQALDQFGYKKFLSKEEYLDTSQYLFSKPRF